MPSKPLLGRPVVVGISEAVIAIRRVDSASVGCCNPRNATRAAEAQEIRENRICITLSRERYAISMQITDQKGGRLQAEPRVLRRSQPDDPEHDSLSSGN